MGSHGSPWVPMGIHGSPWVPMGSHESPWVPMGPHGFPWVPMGSHGEIEIEIESKSYHPNRCTSIRIGTGPVKWLIPFVSSQAVDRPLNSLMEASSGRVDASLFWAPGVPNPMGPKERGPKGRGPKGRSPKGGDPGSNRGPIGVQ